MKAVTIEGKKYDVPDWVNWVAMNEDGEWRGFENKPELYALSNTWHAIPGKSYFITLSAAWKDTLRKL